MTTDISNLWRYDLRKGSTDHPRNGACLFDAGMWLVYGKIGDNPPCSCPIIRAYAVALNDYMPTKKRQLLKPFILRVVGNRDPAAEAARLHFIILETLRKIVPLILDPTLPMIALNLRSLPDNANYSIICAAAHAAHAAHAAAYAALAADAAAHAAAYAALAAHAAAHAAHAAHAAAHAALCTAHAAAHAALCTADAAAHAALCTADDAPIWNGAIQILNDVLRIGKQSPEFDESSIIQAIQKFELVRQG
jgi:hypothetical protein